MAAHVFRFAEKLLVDHGASFELIQVVQVDHRVVLLESSIIESPLGQSPNQWHLAAFESEPKAAAGARFLAFVTLTARFAVTRTFSTAEPLHAMPRTRTWSQILQ